jgi:geranyl-CoA carboxylase beta subunit
MHANQTGLCEYLAADDADAIGQVRELVARLNWARAPKHHDLRGTAPHYDGQELLGIMPQDPKKPVDMREVIARICDASEFLEFKRDYGSGTVCGHASVMGHALGIITNNGPIDPAGATKATHFIQACCQAALPIVYLQNTTGYIVGRAAEEHGMIKHGSKMIQAVANASVPQITIHCGASFGAGNYGMCGRGFHPRFIFSWPSARTAVMGGEQAAGTMAAVMEGALRRRGQPIDEAAIESMKSAVVRTFDAQTSAFYTSGLLLDDGVIDPRDTRQVLGLALDLCEEAAQRDVVAMQFGVARP